MFVMVWLIPALGVLYLGIYENLLCRASVADWGLLDVQHLEEDCVVHYRFIGVLFYLSFGECSCQWALGRKANENTGRPLTIALLMSGITKVFKYFFFLILKVN